jgi:DNA-directed RNA polymerase subunit RPC12/RpoP
MNTLVSGQWYLRYTCKECGITQVLYPDFSRGRAKVATTYVAQCPNCGHKASYDSNEIERYQHPMRMTIAS